MSTPFTDIYDLFLSHISDSQFLAMDQVSMEGIMQNYLLNSLPRFRQCQQDLDDYDLTNSLFNIDLTIDEKVILSNCMLQSYLNQNIYRIELMKQSLSFKDYTMYSQAQHIHEMLSMRDSLEHDIDNLIMNYSYRFGGIDDLS